MPTKKHHHTTYIIAHRQPGHRQTKLSSLQKNCCKHTPAKLRVLSLLTVTIRLLCNTVFVGSTCTKKRNDFNTAGYVLFSPPSCWRLHNATCNILYFMPDASISVLIYMTIHNFLPPHINIFIVSLFAIYVSILLCNATPKKLPTSRLTYSSSFASLMLL